MGLWTELLGAAGEVARSEARRLGENLAEAARRQAGSIGRSAGLTAACAIVGLAALAFAVVALFVMLQNATGTVTAALIVSGCLLAVSGVLLLLARRR